MQWTSKKSAAIIASCVLLGYPVAFAQKQNEAQAQASTEVQSTKARTAHVQKVIKDWKEKPRQVAMDLMGKYGPPDEITQRRLIWHNNGPWKRTELINEEVDHKFPMPHKDMLYQVVSLQVPPEKFSEIAAFDGSVIIERTRGEIAAFCDKEPANFLALNLAYDIATGKRSAADARKVYGEQIAALASKQPAPLTEKLLFQPQQNAGFVDQQTIEPTDAQKEQMKKMGAVKR